MSAEPVVTGVISILAALSLKECICSIWYFLLNTKMTDGLSSLENHLHLHLLIWEFKGKSSSLERPPSVHTLFITYKEDRHGQQLGITAKLVCFFVFFSFFLEKNSVQTFSEWSGCSKKKKMKESSEWDVFYVSVCACPQVSLVLSALQAGNKGTQACITAASAVSGIIADLDTTIMFASAGTLNAENDESFANHR